MGGDLRWAGLPFYGAVDSTCRELLQPVRRVGIGRAPTEPFRVKHPSSARDWRVAPDRFVNAFLSPAAWISSACETTLETGAPRERQIVHLFVRLTNRKDHESI